MTLDEIHKITPIIQWLENRVLRRIPNPLITIQAMEKSNNRQTLLSNFFYPLKDKSTDQIIPDRFFVKNSCIIRKSDNPHFRALVVGELSRLITV